MTTRARTDPLARPIVWFVLGIVVAAIVQFSQMSALGGNLTALLAVGEVSEARPLIEADLADVTLVPFNGHDGQSTYLVARAPLGDSATAAVLDHAGFRYRRILLPALGSLLGLLPPGATVVGLAVWGAVGIGLGGAALARIASRQGRSPWLALAAVLAPGALLSLLVTTPDALALGLTLAAIAAWSTGRPGWAIALLCCAALTKEVYLVVGWALAAITWPHDRRRAALTAALPTGALAIWSTIVTVRVGGGFSPRGNLGWPVDGILSSVDVMRSTGTNARFWWWFAVLSVVAGVAVLVGRRDWRWWVLLGPWLLLAIVSTNWVWEIGNNAARAFAPIVPLTVLAAAGIDLRPRVSRARP